MTLMIRKAVMADVPQIVHVHVDAWRHSYRGYVADEIIDSPRFMVSEERVENMRRVIEKGLVYVAEQDKKIIGIAGIAEEEKEPPELKIFYIAPDYQRQGVGAQIFKYILDDLRKKGIQKLSLWTMKNYPVSNNFYQKMGGTLTGNEKRIKIGVDTIEYLFQVSK